MYDDDDDDDDDICTHRSMKDSPKTFASFIRSQGR